jgi:redox-sensing transcriptional repressor
VTTVQRLPGYLRLVRELQRDGIEVVSSAHLAEILKAEAIQIRKDFGYIGITGRPKTGYRVDELVSIIEACLSWNRVQDAVLVGAGNLGRALMGYRGFATHGQRIVAAFDADAEVVGDCINGISILPMADLAAFVQQQKVRMAILTVSPEAAQPVADQLVGAGIEGIWNFTGKKLSVPDGVIVQDQDIATGLAVLSAKLTYRSEPGC